MRTLVRKADSRVFFTWLVALSPMLVPGCNESLKSSNPGRFTSHSNPGRVERLEPQATEIIEQALADADPRIRANAVEVVASTRQINLMPKVQRLLTDDVVPVRFTAALAVGDTEYVLARKAVQRLLKDYDENVRIAAAYALGKLWVPQSFDVIRRAVNSKDQTIRANATMLVGKIGDRSDRELLFRTLRSPDSGDKVRLQAVEAMARLGDKRAYARLWAMLISAFADDRAMGIAGMGALGTEEAKNALITMLSDDVPEIRLAAAEHLGMLGDRVGEAVVLDVFDKKLTAGLDRQDRERVNVRTALAMGRIGTDAVTEFLPGLLADESKFVRMAAAKAVFQRTANK